MAEVSRVARLFFSFALPPSLTNCFLFRVAGETTSSKSLSPLSGLARPSW